MCLKYKKIVKKLELVLATFIPMIVVRKKMVENAKSTRAGKDNEDGEYLIINLAQVLYIECLITFWKKFMLALLNSDSKINSIYPTFAKELGLPISLTHFKA